MKTIFFFGLASWLSLSLTAQSHLPSQFGNFHFVNLVPACFSSTQKSPFKKCLNIEPQKQKLRYLLQILSPFHPQTEALLRTELNLLEEFENLLRSDPVSGTRVQRLIRKYLLLEELVLTTSPIRTVNHNLVYHPLELKAVNDTFEAFGPLYIGESLVEETWEAPLPWAGHWYPRREKTLFEGINAPLAKLKRILKKKGITSKIVSWENEHFEGGSEAWEGLCAAWATASVLSTEPAKDIISYDETLTPADQKALLTKIHEKFPFRLFGTIYKGTAHTDGTYQDLRPEAFHRIVQKEIGEARKPILVDDEAGTEIWSKPVFKVRWRSERDSRDEKVFHVTAKVYMVKHRGTETNVPTSVWDDAIMHNYNYKLYVDTKETMGNTYRVIAGEWVDSSWEDHPDFVMIPNKNGKRGSYNTELDKYIAIVENILGLN